MIADVLTGLLLAAALFFFVAGTVALFRFPDLYARLHALTKADNVGLGLAVAALMLQADRWTEVFKLALIWFLVLAASATVCFLIGNEAYRRGQQPWTCARDGESSRGTARPARPL
ncbi:MAG TPA: monovalent cation/H(+) antiporter subunit G [Candidatus Paceibacterota bacterium]|nr:monovalent cation/H(+) antiporter subunit G [Verrucomicrobiota bacterium]HOX01991.1 monovalent cation/H(+) antiporter subunit G [Verrucomicrobiota bacterium]HRZ44846.1 monovalent cation/H(+) antiporter subunit G [Candidatus Paceibacterota bacterium]HRZ93776.1 monovalent cation/H(+) antiporter subunit G [Candidatus Paceibacterota bacterium]